MNTGILMSYVIGGFVILMILSVGFNVSFSSTELTYNQIQKERGAVVKEVLLYDIPKIGYNRDMLPDTLLANVGENFIEFYTNLDNSSDRSLELIRWELTDIPVTATKNPDDYVLRRVVHGSTSDTTDFTSGVTAFNILYFSELGSTSPVAVPISARTDKSSIDSIIQIEIELITESADDLQYSKNTDSNYVRSMWKKRFSPVNLRDL